MFLLFWHFLPSIKKARQSTMFFYVSVASIFELKFELHHALLPHNLKGYAVMDPNVHGQWARPSLCMFILKKLYAAECEGLVCETMEWHHRYVAKMLNESAVYQRRRKEVILGGAKYYYSRAASAKFLGSRPLNWSLKVKRGCQRCCCCLEQRNSGKSIQCSIFEAILGRFWLSLGVSER